jgi:hypothetical protein
MPVPSGPKSTPSPSTDSGERGAAQFRRRHLGILPALLGGLLLAALTPAGPLWAQGITTAQVTGQVTSAAGNPLQAVRIVVMDPDGGMEVSALSRADGRYTLPGVDPGGPYRIEARGIGYRTEALESLYLLSGRVERIDFVLSRPEGVDEGPLHFGAGTGSTFSAGRNGLDATFGGADTSPLPSLTRDGIDPVRTLPQVGGFRPAVDDLRFGGGLPGILLLPGAREAPEGRRHRGVLPGTATPLLRSDLTTFDPRHGGSRGVRFDAGTARGTNEFRVTASRFGGIGPGGGRVTGSDLALAVGGPLVEDRAHFFVAAERSRRTDLLERRIRMPDSEATARAEDAADFLLERYDHSPASLDALRPDSEVDQLFARVDLRITPQHHLTLHHHRVSDGIEHFPQARGLAFLRGDAREWIRSDGQATVARLNSKFGGRFYNELRIGHARGEERRTAGGDFARIQVDLGGGALAHFGPTPTAGPGPMDRERVEISNDFLFSWGRHDLTVGAERTTLRSTPGPRIDAFGLWEFGSVEALRNESPERYVGAVRVGSGEAGSAFSIEGWALHAHNRWEATDELTLTLGARFDGSSLSGLPPVAGLPQRSDFDPYRRGAVEGVLHFNPRLSVHWGRADSGLTQFRGGVGLFTEPMPTGAIAGVRAGVGAESWRIVCTGSGVPTFTPDPSSAPGICADGLRVTPRTIHLVDPELGPPRFLRIAGGVDRELGVRELLGTVEFVWSGTRSDLLRRNLLVEPDPDGGMREGREVHRPVRISGGPGGLGVGEAIELTNTDEGHAWSLTAQLRRPVADGWGAHAAYTLSEASVVDPGARWSTRSFSALTPTAGDPNAPAAGRPGELARHRLVAGATFAFDLLDDSPLHLALLYIGESGGPYAFRYEGDVNGDGIRTNDLIRVPAGPDEVRFLDNADGDVPGRPSLSAEESWDRLDRFIDAVACLRDARGSILDPGACRAPSSHRIDVRARQEVGFGEVHRAEITLDVLNLGNLVRRGWGRAPFVPSGTLPLLAVEDGDDVVDGQLLLQPFTLTEPPFSTRALTSRFQVEVGLRYRF